MHRCTLSFLLLVACGTGKVGAPDDTGDGGTDGSTDSATDSGTDSATDSGSTGVPVLSVHVVGDTVRTSGEVVEVQVTSTVDGTLSLSMGGAALGEVEVDRGSGTTTVTLPACLEAPVVASFGEATAESDVLLVTPDVLLDPGLSLAYAQGDLPDLAVTLYDAVGGTVSSSLPLTLTGDGDAVLAEPLDGASTYGVVTFRGGEATGVGALPLRLQGEGDCPLDAALGTLLIGETRSLLPVFPPEARVGQDYGALLPAAPDVVVGLPDGIVESGGMLAGVPADSGARLVQAARMDGATAVAMPIRLSVLPTSDDDLPDATATPSDDGPYDADAVELVVPSITTSRGTYRNVPVRVAYPGDGAGGVAAGRFPVIVFHHAAHSPADIYDDYTDLHGHWASHGVIVASIDSQVNVSGQAQSWSNLDDMASFQLATVDWLRDLPGDALLASHVDGDRVFVSGHSRGGGASMMSLWRDESLLGAICFEPVSPLQTPSQTWSDPDRNGDRALPARPILFFSAALDLDEPWPLVDVSYEQTVGPTPFVTIHGANHEDTYDAGTAGGLTSVSTISRAERHAVDQHYSTAFLYRYGGAGEAAGSLSWEAALFGRQALYTDLSDEGVSVHGRRHLAAEVAIDRFADEATPERNDWGGDNVGEGLDTDENAEPYAEGLATIGRYDERGTRIAGWARARLLEWDADDAELALFLDEAGADLSDHRELVLRLARDCPSPYRGSCPDADVDVDIELWDVDGHRMALPAAEGMGARGIVGRHWSRVQLPLDAFVGVDLSRVEGVAVVLTASGWTDGALWVDDLRLE